MTSAGRQRGLERARVVEELGHHAVEPVHLLDDDLQELAVLAGELARVEVLDGALDGGQRVADLVGQAGRHLAERGQAVALLHLLVELGVLDHQGAAVGHLEQRGDLVGGEGLGHPLVPAGQEADRRSPAASGMQMPAFIEAITARASPSRFSSSATAAAARRGRCAPRLGRAGRQEAAQLGHAPVEVLEQHRLLAAPAAAASSARAAAGSRKGAGAGPRKSSGRKPGRSSASSQSEAWVTRRVSTSPSSTIAASSAGSMTVAAAVAQRLQPAHQLVPLAEEGGHHPLLDLLAQRLEEREDHEGGDHRVEVEELAPVAHPGDQAAVDRHQHQAERRDHHDLPEELVQVEQPVALQRLRQEEHVDGEGDGAEPLERVGDAEARAACRAAERPMATSAPDEQVEQPGPLDARGGGRASCSSRTESTTARPKRT